MDWSKKRSRYLRGMLTVAVFLCLCITAGCKKKAPEKTAEEGFFTKMSVFDCLRGQAFCDKGMVQIEDGLMIFYEYETGRSYPLCSDVYCEHLPYSESTNPDPVCEATMKDLKAACVHGDYVYAIQQTGVQEVTVQERNLKGKGYRTVAKLPYCQAYSSQGNNAIIGDKAYLLLAEIDNSKDDGLSLSYTSNDLYTFLVELDLQTGKYKTLFHIEEKEKYKILQTVYAKEGIYCRCYYEAIEMSADFTDFTVNDYREKFFYVPYDGNGVKELCPELTGLTSFHGEEQPEVWVSGIGEYGVYLENGEMTRVECYRYDGNKDTVFEVPEGDTRLRINGISGNKMLLTLTTPEMTYKTAGLDLTDRKNLLCDNPDNTGYVAVGDGIFWKLCSDETGAYRELWRYEDIFSEEGKPLLSISE